MALAIKCRDSVFRCSKPGLSDERNQFLVSVAMEFWSLEVLKTMALQTLLRNTSSDYRLKENVTPMTGAADRVKALKPCRYNFKADPDTNRLMVSLLTKHRRFVPEAVTGTKDATEAIGTLFDWDGKVREEDVTEPAELTYSEEVIDDPGQEGKEAVYSEPVLIQEYQPAVYGEPELISPAYRTCHRKQWGV